jgi:hypothetical protein
LSLPPQPAVARPAAPPLESSAPGVASPVSLWEILTPEERAFFAEQAALGPLSYAPGAAPALAPTGQRLDVRA